MIENIIYVLESLKYEAYEKDKITLESMINYLKEITKENIQLKEEIQRLKSC